MSAIDVIMMFGATGDLARKMLFPALYRLEERGVLDQRIVGVALDSWDVARFRHHVDGAVAAAIAETDPTIRSRLLSRLAYVHGDYGDRETFTRLASAVHPEDRLLHYLAIPPEMFESVVSRLDDAGLMQRARILVEKPFARDLTTARHLNGVLHKFVSEESIYRIDHFLGKESVEHLLAFRYANPIFDAAWNGRFVDHVQVTMAESFGVGGRGRLYESLGVVRDVIQNHLLQVICLLTMESPNAPSAEAFGAERFRVLAATEGVSQADVLYGQYEGYREVEQVAADSPVPTYVALRLAIDSPRWKGVPFFIRAGKALATTATQAVVVFKSPPPLSFSTQEDRPAADRLVFKIGPSDGVDLCVQTKLPGDGLRLTTTPLSVDYESVFGRIPLAYERVLKDALACDRSQFAHEDAVEEAWRIVAEIIDPSEPPIVYPQGSWGPAGAAGFLGEGRSWLNPS